MNYNILTKNIIALIIALILSFIGLGIFYSFYPMGSGISATLISINVFILSYIAIRLLQKEISINALRGAVAENTVITKEIKKDVDSILKRYSIDVSDVASGDESAKFLVAEMRYMNEILNQLSESFENSLRKDFANNDITSDELSDQDIVKAKPYSGYSSNRERKVEDRLDKTEILRILRHAIREQKVEMLLQPIVSLPQRKHRHYECFSQIRCDDGDIISPNNFIQLARDNELISIIDHTLILRCVQILRKAMKEDFKVSFFCNFTPESLRNEKMLDCINDFFKTNPVAAKSIVFEIDYYSLQNDLSESIDNLKELHKKGWTFSVDQFKDPFSLDIKTLKECGVKYLKADADVIVKAINDNNHERLKQFEASCKKNNIDVIISKIEKEEDLKSLLDYSFDYGQGYLFGSPVVSNY